MANAAFLDTEANLYGFRFTQGVTANTNYMGYNNTQSNIRMEVSPINQASNIDFRKTLSPGEGFIYRPTSSGTVTITGYQSHSVVTPARALHYYDDAGDEITPDSNEARWDTNTARLIFTIT